MRKFNRGELKIELKKYAEIYKLEIKKSVSSKKVRLITRKLIEEGWDAKETSVAEALRKMGYVEGKRK